MLIVGNKSSLRKQLLVFLILSIFILSLINSITAGWIATKQSSKILEHQSFQIVSNLAQNSILSLLTESQENANDAINQVLNFNDVVGVALFNASGDPLVHKGRIEWSENQLHEWLTPQKASIVEDDREHWIVSAPINLQEIRDEGNLTDFDTLEDGSLFLGHAVINISKTSLNNLTNNLFSNILLIGLGFAVLLVWLQNAGLKRLTAPLVNLSETMNRARRSGEHTFANIEGAKELRQIAGNYNAMMKALSKQEERLIELNAGLESQVAIRTKELTSARDTALTAVRTQSEFLANISHELRTPLQAIMGYIELVREELENEALYTQVDDLESALESSNRLLSLINSILDLAKCESGETEVTLQTTSINNITIELETIIRPLATQNRNQLQISLPDTDCPISIDKEKTLQVLINLLSNACKFTSEGRIDLRTFIENNHVYWVVSDTGIGIHRDNFEIIFDKFRQIDGSVKREYSGTGLGLAISRHFAEMMGGNISLKSTLGQGSEFTLYLPLNPNTAPATIDETSLQNG